MELFTEILILVQCAFLAKNWQKITKMAIKKKFVIYIYSCLIFKNTDLANFLLHKNSVSTKKFAKSVFYAIFTVVKSVDYCIVENIVIEFPGYHCLLDGVNHFERSSQASFNLEGLVLPSMTTPLSKSDTVGPRFSVIVGHPAFLH